MMLGRYAFAASQFCRGADVLDTCCGLGWGAYLTAQFAQQVTAFDINPALAAFSTQTWPATNIEWLSGSTLDLSFLNGKKYNVVLGMETIEHFSAADGEVYIQQIVSVLHAGGVFIGTSAFPDTAEEARVLEQENPYHLHIHTQQEMRKLLERYFSRATIIGNWMFIAVK